MSKFDTYMSVVWSVLSVVFVTSGAHDLFWDYGGGWAVAQIIVWSVLFGSFMTALLINGMEKRDRT